MVNERRKEGGFSVIENLVAIAILGVASVATIPLLTLSFASTSASRTHVSVLAEVEGLVSGYRTMPYNQLLQKIGSDIQQIENGESASETVDSPNGRASFLVTFTAVKSSPIGFPEAVRILIVVTQHQSQLGNRSYQFETLVTQVS